MRNLYDTYRERLAALATDEIPLAAMDKASLKHSWWAQNRSWQRTYGRFHLGEAPLVTLIYESADAPQEICVIDLLTTPPTAVGAGQTLIQEKIGWLKLTHFPHDPQLPALAHLLSLPGQPYVLRYRPQKRCTIRFTGSTAEGDAYRFAKVFNDDRGAAIHVESLALWQAANRGELDFAVARPLAWDATMQTLWQGAVPGQPLVKRLLSQDGPDLAERMGSAAASLTRSSLRPLQIMDGQKQQKRSATYAKRLRTFFPALAPAIDFLMDKLTTVHSTIGPTCLRPIHGAPHAHQWLDDGTRLGLVDFDGFALGDPELDAATFMAEMDFEDSEKAPVAAINQRFLAGYEAVAGPLDERLLHAYRAHKRLSKALRNAYAVRADNDIRVERALGQAITCALQVT